MLILFGLILLFVIISVAMAKKKNWFLAVIGGAVVAVFVRALYHVLMGFL
jgi:hypothetical protein